MLVEKLNSLLSSYQIVGNRTRSFRWIIKGDNLFELLNFAEALTNDALLKVEEIADRIIRLGGKPVLSLSEMVEHSDIKESVISSNSDECVEVLLNDLQQLRKIEAEILKISEQEKDSVTANLMSFYIIQQLKSSWILNQYLNQEQKVLK